MSEYRTRKGTPYYPDELRTAECPVSEITPRSQQLLTIFVRMRHAREASGASMFGPDLSRWPVWAVDAAVTIAVCEIRESNARTDAEMSEIQR